MWCIAEITDEYREKMMDLLELYEREYDPEYPIVCFDEKNKQLLGDTKQPIPAKPGKIRKQDYQYKRNGTVNMFVSVEPKGKFRKVKVTEQRRKQDFAKEVKRIINLKRYNKSKKILFVLDNLNTHFEKSFYETFSKIEAKKMLKRIEFHYTPKHASWLNMAEIEINVLSSQCLNQKIPTLQNMRQQTTKWSRERNGMNKGINWQFTREKAKKKFNF